MEMMNGQREGKGWKPPTRLQKKAPASLNLDHHQVSYSEIPPEAIPLLSPLVLSPQPLPEMSLEKPQHDGKYSRSEAALPLPLPADAHSWQHPAVPTFIDPSSLFTLFQSQCIIINPAQ